MRQLHPSIYLASFLFLISCDKIETPIEAPIVAEGDTYPFIDSTSINDSLRIVLIEEFTGHKCSFCPGNTKQLLDLQKEHEENIMIVSIHAGSTFAKPDPPKYPTDFNTEYGTTVHDDFKIGTFAYPSALISRRIIDERQVFPSHPIWSPAINTVLDEPAIFALGLAADYSESENKISLRLSGKALEDISGEHRIIIVAVEDSVIAPQKDVQSTLPEERVPDYPHRHVLRGKVNGGNQNGEVLFSSLLAEEWVEAKVFADLPSNVVNADKVTIMAIVIATESQEVIQAEEVHLHILP